MLIENILKKLNEKFKNDTPRLNHILGVYRKAMELSRFHKVDSLQSQISALFHDYTKNNSLEFHLSVLDKKIINKYKQATFMYHAFSAPIVLEKEFKINDKKILNAIRKHVWGHKTMNKLDKIIFLSDKLENNRDFPQVNYFRKLAFEDLDQAVYQLLKFNFEYYKIKGGKHFEEQLEILASLEKKIKK
jgi:predicted HD superfamily hydrolase involved in NAD metabolism